MGIFLSRENLDKLGIIPAQDIKTLTNSATEYTFAIPDGTKRLIFGMRSGNYNFQYGWATGALNFTVPAGSYRDMDQIHLISQTLYLKCNDSAGEIIEIEFFT